MYGWCIEHVGLSPTETDADGDPGTGRPTSVKRRLWFGSEEELARLKRELSKVTRERDFLKDAAAYFAKQSPSGTR